MVARRKLNKRVPVAPASHATTNMASIKRPVSANDDRQLSPVGVARRDAAIRGGVAGRITRQRGRVGPIDRSIRRHAERRPMLRGETFEREDRTIMLDPREAESASHRFAIDQVVSYRKPDNRNNNNRWSEAANCRGKFGESLIHILIVNQSNEHLILLILILNLWPQLVIDTFKSDKFKKLNCLHLAVAYGNEQLLAHLIELSQSHDPKLVDAPVIGSLFRLPDLETNQPEVDKSASSIKSGREKAEREKRVYWCDKMSHWPTANGDEHYFLFDKIKLNNSGSIKNPKIDLSSQNTHIYLGHSPLSWSVSFNSRSMFELLVVRGKANQDSGDPLGGNGCLHQVVINNSTGWTRFLVKMGANQEMENKQKLTPLKLAAHLGRVELFEELMELSAFEFWSYSMVGCCGYPLTSLDSILEKKSALAVILESNLSDNEQKSRLLSSVVIKKLLEEKWRVFARREFYYDLILTLIHLFLLTLTISLREPTLTSEANILLSPFKTNKFSWTLLSESIVTRRKLLVQITSELATWLLSSWQLLQLVKERRRYRSLSQQWVSLLLLS